MFTWTEVKYQLFRNRGRMVLLILVAALLLGSMAFYLGNIESSRTALENLGDAVPVTVHVTSTDGSKMIGLNIERSQIDSLMAAGTHDPQFVMECCGYLSEDSKARYREGGYDGDTKILGLNTLESSGLRVSDVRFAEGYDESIFSGSDPVCLLSESYAKANGFSLGDTVTLPVFGYVHVPYIVSTIPVMGVHDDVTIMDDSQFTVVGFFPSDGVISEYTSGMPTDMLVPQEWLWQTGMAHGVQLVYTNFSAVLDEPLKLNEFKQALPQMSFITPQRFSGDPYTGAAVSLDDETFIKMANGYLNNIAAFERFLPAFFVLAIGLATLIIFLVLRSARRDIAIANSLGRTKRQCGAAYLLTILLTDLAGCVIALPLMVFAAGLGVLSALGILGVFLLCSVLGSLIALLLLLRFDPIDLLTKVD